MAVDAFGGDEVGMPLGSGGQLGIIGNRRQPVLGADGVDQLQNLVALGLGPLRMANGE